VGWRADGVVDGLGTDNSPGVFNEVWEGLAPCGPLPRRLQTVDLLQLPLQCLIILRSGYRVFPRIQLHLL
jgi:hypothetical protein